MLSKQTRKAVFIHAIILWGVSLPIWAGSNGNNQADFQNWLKSNGHPVIAQNNPSSTTNSLPLSVTHSEAQATETSPTTAEVQMPAQTQADNESHAPVQTNTQPQADNNSHVSAQKDVQPQADNSSNVSAQKDVQPQSDNSPQALAQKDVQPQSDNSSQASAQKDAQPQPDNKSATGTQASQTQAANNSQATAPSEVQTQADHAPIVLAQNEAGKPQTNNMPVLAQNNESAPVNPPPSNNTPKRPPPFAASGETMRSGNTKGLMPINPKISARATDIQQSAPAPMSANTPTSPPPINVTNTSPNTPPPLGASVPARKPILMWPRRIQPTFQQSQEIMRRAAPPSPPPTPIENAAFNSMMKKNMPLSPDQVVRLRQLIDVSQRAAAVPANIPPKPVSSTLIVNLAPGTTPPAIRLSQGYVSSLVFVDSSGAPWPIDSYDVGDPKATNIQWEPKSNVLLMQAVSPYSDSNLVIRLNGLPTPVTLELVSGQRVVDYRVDIHVSGIGPNTKDLPTGVNLPSSANQILLNVLDGVAPPGSKLLTVVGGDAQAWLLGNKMYVRTRFTMLSPGWIGKMVSPDGMNAYELQRTSSVLVSQYGQPVEFKVEGF